MTRHLTLPVILATVLATLVPAQAPFKLEGWEEKDPTKLTRTDRTRIQAEMMRLGTPGKEHREVLAPLAGKWKLTNRMWMQPGQEKPMTTHADGEARVVLGGRFLELTAKGKMMGMDVESRTMFGFDRRWNHFTAVAFDSMGTYWVSAMGKKDPETGKIVMYGEDKDPTASATQKYDFVLTIESADRYVWEIIFLDKNHGNEGPFKMVEMVAERVK